MIQPAALGERIFAQVAVLQRVEAAMDKRGPPLDPPAAIEWFRTLDEVRMVLSQHRAFEKV